MWCKQINILLSGESENELCFHREQNGCYGSSVLSQKSMLLKFCREFETRSCGSFKKKGSKSTQRSRVDKMIKGTHFVGVCYE
mmetsp:Transcript_27138/g.40640  ORF Transcript_27138/g.40640 Transcript_27138/m.40640 type:complete len:83 (+) Transcript_27138:1445-1693(+)